ncbi:hypothetical protein H257_08135 [Aphanomyces astaci]|uniref:Uncharacterized protein n=1 Tax=Aphanomyces astaci TaxID=112090 RepID=W4GHZ3_APHAT|nr:hypothetical protein H257_08135 [Aphanomyces astaci]ETV78644.1 hypothetical protein H257_08135 [Aphanomyces astaci]|eukprot:XP_009832225.1 hypothetical protein H257_08135 [Aphanomyces astaci]
MSPRSSRGKGALVDRPRLQHPSACGSVDGPSARIVTYLFAEVTGENVASYDRILVVAVRAAVDDGRAMFHCPATLCRRCTPALPSPAVFAMEKEGWYRTQQARSVHDAPGGT